jgi:hypothetical protein
MRNN